MISGSKTEHQVKRFKSAISHSMSVVDWDDREFIVEDNDSDTDESHVVNLLDYSCTCEDYMYNCSPGQYCKHIYRVVLNLHGMIHER